MVNVLRMGDYSRCPSVGANLFVLNTLIVQTNSHPHNARKVLKNWIILCQGGGGGEAGGKNFAHLYTLT